MSKGTFSDVAAKMKTIEYEQEKKKKKKKKKD